MRARVPRAVRAFVVGQADVSIHRGAPDVEVLSHGHSQCIAADLRLGFHRLERAVREAAQLE